MVNFKEIYHFSRFQRGSNISRGWGPTFSRVGGSNCLFSIETHIIFDFPGGGGGGADQVTITITCVYSNSPQDYTTDTS